MVSIVLFPITTNHTDLFSHRLGRTWDGPITAVAVNEKSVKVYKVCVLKNLVCIAIDLFSHRLGRTWDGPDTVVTVMKSLCRSVKSVCL